MKTQRFTKTASTWKFNQGNSSNSSDIVIERINQLLSLLELNFQIDDIIETSENGQKILITYDQEEERKYELNCHRGLALRRIFPRF